MADHHDIGQQLSRIDQAYPVFARAAGLEREFYEESTTPFTVTTGLSASADPSLPACVPRVIDNGRPRADSRYRVLATIPYY